jgi:predicted Zn-dependent peptidase
METVRLDRDVFQTIASNGVRILSERVASVRSVAVGIWVRSASVHEPRGQMGVSHLLEHMVFKGTARRSAQEIALELEARGGSLDAYTSRDTTAYQARVLDGDLPRALDVLTDLVRQPALRQRDLDLERNVILEEINTVQDTPDDLVFDLTAEALWPEHPYGYSILGTPETVTALSAEHLKRLHERAYYPGNCIIAGAGNLEHQALVDLAGSLGWLDAPNGSGAPPATPQAQQAKRGLEVRHTKETAQTHIVLATDTVRFSDPRKYALMALSSVFGGGMSSRLFQRVREELGLAYAVYSYSHFYGQVGVLGTYVGTQPKTATKALEAIRAEYARLAREGLSPEALDQAKRQTQGQLTLTLESPTSRMYRLASFAVHGEPYRGLDATLSEIGALTPERVTEVATEFFAPGRQTLVWLGPN